MRVLLINQVFHPDPQATAQYASRLAEELVKRGHAVTVLAGRRDYDHPERTYPEVETWRGVKIVRVWNAGLGHASMGRRIIDFATFLLAASLRGLFLPRADVVLTLTTPPLVSVLGVVLARLWQARFVYWVMDLNPDEVIAVGWLQPESPLARFLETVSRWCLRQAAKVIVPDIYMKERIVGKGISDEKIAVIPLWTQSEVRFDPAARERFRREHGLEDRYVVMYAGNHTPCHPLTTLIEAAVILRDEPHIHFCYVGGGMEWVHLRDRAQAESWGNASFLGYQPFSELAGLLSAADMQVVVMGDPFVGIIHPCKVYNFLGVERPFIYVGPQRSHITDLIHDAGMENVTASFRHGDSVALAETLRTRSRDSAGLVDSWPGGPGMAPWSEISVLKRLMAVLECLSDVRKKYG